MNIQQGDEDINYPTEEELLALRTEPIKEATKVNKDIWYWYAGSALPTIPCDWGKRKNCMANTKLHESITISDEAFIMSVIINYQTKWEEAAKSPAKARSGRKKGEKWNDDMIKTFSRCYKKIQEARSNEHALEWEMAYQEYYKGLKENEEDYNDSNHEDGESNEEESSTSIPMDDLE